MASREEAQTALGFIERALEIDPDYPRALAEYALTLGSLAYFGFRDDRDQSLDMALKAARKATALDPDDPFSRTAQGVVCRMTRRYEEALPALLKAVELNPNYAYAHAHLGMTLAYLGRSEEGLEHTQRALRLSPRDPHKYMFLQAQAVVLFSASRYADAVELTRLALQERAGFPAALRVMAASLALMGDIARAQEALRELEELQSNFSLAWVDRNTEGAEDSRARLLEGLRLAGLR
jgi:tetratricopeptide (TPR) repeat protein